VEMRASMSSGRSARSALKSVASNPAQAKSVRATSSASFALGAGLVTLCPRAANAADPIAAPPSVQTGGPERRLAMMNSEIELFASRARAQRRTTLLAGLVGAAALVPAGYVLSQRSDAVSQSIGTGMEVGGAAPLAFSALSLSRSGMERLRDRLEEGLGATTSRAELAEAMEADWQHTAEAAHDRRILFGVVGLVLGTASTAAGLFFLLSDPYRGTEPRPSIHARLVARGPRGPVHGGRDPRASSGEHRGDLVGRLLRAEERRGIRQRAIGGRDSQRGGAPERSIWDAGLFVLRRKPNIPNSGSRSAIVST
jgi:hypothetical protein